jgi:hypothetical protein
MTSETSKPPHNTATRKLQHCTQTSRTVARVRWRPGDDAIFPIVSDHPVTQAMQRGHASASTTRAAVHETSTYPTPDQPIEAACKQTHASYGKQLPAKAAAQQTNLKMLHYNPQAPRRCRHTIPQPRIPMLHSAHKHTRTSNTYVVPMLARAWKPTSKNSPRKNSSLLTIFDK